MASGLSKMLVQPSPQLSIVIGSTAPLSRSEVVKRLWAYIHAHNLQDTVNRRQIHADDALRPIFGADEVNMFEMTSLVSKHLTKVS